MPSTGEWLLILFVGILVFGRDLPNVGRRLGRTIRRPSGRASTSSARWGRIRRCATHTRRPRRDRAPIDQTKRLVDPRRVIDDLTRLPPADERPADRDAIDESPERPVRPPKRRVAPCRPRRRVIERPRGIREAKGAV